MIETAELGPKNIYEGIHRGGIKMVSGSEQVVVLKLTFSLM